MGEKCQIVGLQIRPILSRIRYIVYLPKMEPQVQIKIEAQDMLHVLVDAGLDATDAKAIIFDLLQLPEGGAERQALLEARRQRRKKLPKKKVVVEDLTEEEYEEVEEDEDEDEVEDGDQSEKAAAKPKAPLKPTRIKKPKRVNFSAFGGVADPLR